MKGTVTLAALALGAPRWTVMVWGTKGMTVGMLHLLQVLGRRVEGLRLIPAIRQFRQRYHFQILIRGGTCENLQPLDKDLLVAFEPRLQIHGGEGRFPSVRGLAGGLVGHRDGDGRDPAAAVGQPHGDGGAVRNGDSDRHILKRQLSKTGIGVYLYVACCWQSDPSLIFVSYYAMPQQSRCFFKFHFSVLVQNIL